MKRVYQTFLMLCVVLAMMLTISGCNTLIPAQNDSQDSGKRTDSNEEGESSEVSGQKAEDSEMPSEENQVPPEVLYASVLEKYTTVLSQEHDEYSRTQWREAGLSDLCMYFDASEIGYTFMDTNQDGMPELLVGAIDGDDDCFFTLYTAVENIPVLVAQSSERDRYYLCTDGCIANEGSNSASSGINAYYTIGAQGQRILSEAVIRDYSDYFDKESYWYSTSSTSMDGAEELSWESVELILKKYEYVAIDYTTPFITDSSPKPDSTPAPIPAQDSNTGEPSSAAIAEAFTEIIPQFIAIPGADTDFKWYDDSYTAGVATVYPQSVQDGAFSINGYVYMVMVRLDDGSWFMENYDKSACSISYNYADEYYDFAGVKGCYVESNVEFGNGNAWTNITPLYFAGGSDPTGEDLTCYWISSDGSDSDAAYILRDEDNQIVIYLDAQMKLTSFDLMYFDE